MTEHDVIRLNPNQYKLLEEARETEAHVYVTSIFSEIPPHIGVITYIDREEDVNVKESTGEDYIHMGHIDFALGTVRNISVRNGDGTLHEVYNKEGEAPFVTRTNGFSLRAPKTSFI